MMIRIAVIAVSLALIASCAKVGTLDQPAPLFGQKAKAEYRAKKEAETSAKTVKPSNEPEPLPAEAPPEDNPPVAAAPGNADSQTAPTPPLAAPQ